MGPWSASVPCQDGGWWGYATALVGALLNLEFPVLDLLSRITGWKTSETQKTSGTFTNLRCHTLHLGQSAAWDWLRSQHLPHQLRPVQPREPAAEARGVLLLYTIDRG